MLTIESANSPKFATEDKSVITLNVKFKEFPMELPFSATLTDTMEHGIELFKNAIAGEYGEVGEYVDETKTVANPGKQPVVVGAQEI